MGARHQAEACTGHYITPLTQAKKCHSPLERKRAEHHSSLRRMKLNPLTARKASGSSPQYPWGTSASGFHDPDVVLSGSNQRRRSGAEGVCNTLLDLAQGSPGKTGTPRETGTRGDMEGTTAVQETVAAPVAAASARETAALKAEPVTIPGGAEGGETHREAGQTVRIQSCPADTELSPTMAGFPPLQQPKGQEAENPKNRPRSGESVALAGIETRASCHFYSTSGKREGIDRIPTLR
ncbi:hypothetical protein NDU88_005460 [Pleurodeles waltl]|uniref:Uncharacterized protein n=1 Tax=Pleurodeles waltl TaxID=8319 RepID=A0AAV7L2P8_PLEWA|nr:hypothetical protein NDU88_005460 [Pleurodeles waltl]